MTQIWIKVCVENEEQTKLLDLACLPFDLEDGHMLQALKIFATDIEATTMNQRTQPVLDFEFTPPQWVE